MSHRLQIVVSDSHYAFLDAEADRSSVSIAELVRRAIDTAYGLSKDERVVVLSHTLGRRSGRDIDGLRSGF